MSTKIIPNKGKLLVKPVKQDAVSKGGIILPANEGVEKSEGVIVETGREVRFEAGQKVIYGKYAGDEIVVEGETLRIIRDIEVLATIVDEN